MSYWIELHCDAAISPKCAGLDHDNPTTGCATVEQGRKIVLREANRRGWKRIAGELHCKACVDRRSTLNSNGVSDV